MSGNNGWCQMQSSGEAVEGYIAFLEGKSYQDNPYNTELKYKNWCSGYRNGQDASPTQIKTFNWIYNTNYIKLDDNFMTKEITILAQKQSNGLYGMPLTCTKLDIPPFKLDVDTNPELEVLWSAIIIAIAEQYPGEYFEIFMSSDKGFFIKLDKSGLRNIIYSQYKLEGNKLIYNDGK